MSLKNEIEIDYLDRKTKVSLPKEYSDFIKLCKETFYLSESRSKDMVILYIDEDGDDIPINEEEYNNENARKASFWILNIEDDDDPNDIKNAKDELITKKNDLLNQAKKFKVQLLKQCNEIIESEVKKRNDIHKEKIKKIKKAYEENLNIFKTDIDNIVRESLQTISQNVMSIYNEGLNIIDNEIKESLKGNINNLKKDYEEEINKINFDEIGEQMGNIKTGVKNCMNDFNDLYRESKNLTALCEIDKNIELKCNISKKGVKFKLNVLNKNKTKNKLNGNYILYIIGAEGNTEKFQIKLDLSDVDYGMKQSKEILFKPNIRKEGKYKFRLFIKENNNIISNESVLTLSMNDLGSMNDVI